MPFPTARLSDPLSDRGTECGLVGVSAPFRQLLDQVRRAAETESTVLVSGETGTGKELLARAIHELSPRRPGAFVPVDCAGLAEELIDSELFGHARGAFTGATRERAGKIALAEGGTLFLDAIDCMSPGGQSRLLRVLQEKEIVPLGRDRPQRVSFRLVSSVGEDVQSRVDAGAFRRDLYFRLNVVRLRLPPLRERREDVEELARFLLLDASKRLGKNVHRIDTKALRVLAEFDWPGNVRELASVLECAVAGARGEILYESDLPVYVRVGGARGLAARSGSAARGREEVRSPAAPAAEVPPPPSGGAATTFAEQVASFQRELLVRTLRRTGWSYAACGDELGLAHHQVKYLCAKLGIRRSRFE